MGCNCNDKTPHTHKAYKTAKGNKDCPCGCGGTCGCGDASQPMIHKGQKCPCGCGGVCGVSCNCSHCYGEHGSLGSLGRFDEYPRAKAGLFDPRKIGQPWPEPHPDPLVPYVRANEGLLPYEKYNEFQNKRNSMHGWNETLGGVKDVNTAAEAVSAIMSTLAVPDLSYDYLRQNFEDRESDRFWYINPQGQKVDVQRIPEEKTFFGFVPTTSPYTRNLLLMIRCGGPENKVIYFDTSNMYIDSQERSFLRTFFENMQTAGIGTEQASQMMHNLTHNYPLVFDATQNMFFSTDIDAKNNANGKSDYRSRFAYEDDTKAFEGIASHILDHIVNSAAEQINKNTDLSQQMQQFMLVFLGACLKGLNVRDVAEGISKAIVDQLKKDFSIARRRSKIVFEPEILGNDIEYKGDFSSFSVFNAVNDTKLPIGFDQLQEDLKGALATVIRQRKSAFSQMYKEVLGVREQAASSAQQEQALLQAQQQIEQLQKDKEAIRQAGMQSLANMSKDYASKIEELQARNREIENKDRELSTLKSKTQELNRQVIKTKENNDSKVATAFAGLFAVSTITLAYVHFVKK